MKLWILKPVLDEHGNEPPAWDPWYDKVFGLVVRAESEQEAREIASKSSGDEARSLDSNPAPNPWLDATQTSCSELVAGTESGVVISDFRSA